MDLHVTFAGVMAYGIAVWLASVTRQHPTIWVLLIAFCTVALQCMTITRSFDRAHKPERYRMLLANELQIAVMLAVTVLIVYFTSN
jgi:hypothetical protein